jgi:hypothetical protein
LAFQQLHYTSCEQGLSGFPGYQFSAATAGVSPEVMREVERLTAYEPPPTLSFEPTPAEIADCPVSLCFAPGDGPEATAMLANVVFVGADFSNRFGNYFAHALVTDAAQRELGGLLPIETWQAPFWARAAAASRELPGLSGPLPPGPINRPAVREFLEAHPAASSLPALLTAAFQTVTTGEGALVLTSPDAEDNAHWIAAVSYLLPESMALRMSFTTYHCRPMYCPFHVVGSLPSEEQEMRDSAGDGFQAFDLGGPAATPPAAHELAHLLVRVGTERAAQVWRAAGALAKPMRNTLDEWYAPVAAAAAVHGVPLGMAEREAAAAWFERAARGPGGPPSAELADIARALLADSEMDEPRLLGLLASARDLGVDGAAQRLGELERRLVESQLERIGPRGTAPAAIGVRITSEDGREHGRRGLEAKLAVSDYATAIGLLTWAAEVGVSPDKDAVVECGNAVLGPRALADPQNPELNLVVRAWPSLLLGIGNHLAERAAADPGGVLASMEAGLDRLLRESDFDLHPELKELRILKEAKGLPGRRIGTFADIAGGRRRRSAPTDLEGLLEQLWPEGSWTSTEAREAITVLEKQHIDPVEVLDWVGAAVVRPRPGNDLRDREEYLRLCREVSRHPVQGLLPDSAQAVLAGVERVQEALRRGSGSREQAAAAVSELAPGLVEAPPFIRELLLDQLPERLLRLDAPRLRKVLPGCPAILLERFLQRARPGLDAQRGDEALATDLLWAAHLLSADGDRYGKLLETEVRSSLKHWRRRDLDATAARLERKDRLAAERFQEWREREHQSGLLGQLARRLRPPPGHGG